MAEIPQEYKDTLRKRAVIVKRALANPDGEAFMSLLRDEFKDAELMADTHERTIFNVAKHDLVVWIETHLHLASDDA